MTGVDSITCIAEVVLKLERGGAGKCYRSIQRIYDVQTGVKIGMLFNVCFEAIRLTHICPAGEVTSCL